MITQAVVYTKSNCFTNMSIIGGDLNDRWTFMSGIVGGGVAGSSTSIISFSNIAKLDHYASLSISAIGKHSNFAGSIGDEDFWHDAVGEVG